MSSFFSSSFPPFFLVSENPESQCREECSRLAAIATTANADFREHNASSTHCACSAAPAVQPHDPCPPLPPPSPRSATLSPTRHCSICKINLYRSSIQPEALASLVRGNAAVECRPNGVADCIGSEVRILDRIEPLTAEADLTGEIDCSCPRPRKDTGRAPTE